MPKPVEQTGVNALELNFYSVPGDFKKEGKRIVNEQLDVISRCQEKREDPCQCEAEPLLYQRPEWSFSMMYYARR
ncbi:MAG: hypothetical protein MZV63_46340 [Marinilabiliales bacterium]|nr:hypothetical protein [Marinilabiliales bacterium]